MVVSERNGKFLFFGGLVFTLVVLVWPVLMMLSQPGGDMSAQLAAIAENPGLYKLNFIVASLIAPTFTVVLAVLAFGVETRKKTLVLDRLGGLFLACYAALVTVAYVSQYTYFMSLLAKGYQAEMWYFNNPQSIAYFLNQLGYAFFALGSMMIAYKLLFEEGGVRAIGILLWISGILSLLAFAGLILDNAVLNFCTIISGVVTVPIGVLVVVRGYRLGLASGSKVVKGEG